MLVKVQEVGQFFVKRKDGGDVVVKGEFFPEAHLRTIVPGKRGTLIVFKGGIGLYSWSEDCVSYFHPWSRIKGWGPVEDPNCDAVAGYLYVPLPNQEQTAAIELPSAAEKQRFLDACHNVATAIATPEEMVANDAFGTHPVDDENW